MIFTQGIGDQYDFYNFHAIPLKGNGRCCLSFFLTLGCRRDGE